MDNKGMVAIVRGLPDAGLMVTLLDGGRQYTLMPQTVEINSPSAQPRDFTSGTLSRHSQYATRDVSPGPVRYDSSAQVVDGRYASNYKIEYCHMNPTSPPVELTEFPPQRAHVKPGQENFEVGCFGGTSTRTILNRRNIGWPDRGSTSVSRVSTKSNAFANSLRNYSSLSPGSSSEVVQRLISFSKITNSSQSNRLKLNECITCYQNTAENRYPKYKTKRSYQESPTRDDSIRFRELTKTYKFHKNPHGRLPGVVSGCGVESQSSGNKIHPGDMKIQALHAPSPATNDKESIIDIPITQSKFQDNYVTYAANQEKGQTVKNLKEYASQNVGSIQTTKSLIYLGTTKQIKYNRMLKNTKNPIQPHAKCKKLKHKPKVYGNDIDKIEHNKIITELLSLIRYLNISDGEDKLGVKRKIIYLIILECILEPENSNNLKEEILKYVTKINNTENTTLKNGNTYYGNYKDQNIITHKEPIDSKEQKFVAACKKDLMAASKIHRVIKEEILPMLKYKVCKEDENKVLKSILIKIIKDTIDNVRINQFKHLVNLRTNFKQQDHLDELKEFYGSKKIHNNKHRKKCRYLNVFKKFVKYTAYASNKDNIFKWSKAPIDPKLRSIINICQVLKKIQSSSKFQSKYVTNMLLNQFCATGKRRNYHQFFNYHQKRTNISPFKCLSDTYLVLHDTSLNKSILTRNKIDKTNLHTGTKLLTSIKNKCTIESRIQTTEKNFDDKCDNTNEQSSACENNTSSTPITFNNINKQYIINKEEILDFNNICLLHQVEEKVNMWLFKYSYNVDPLHANKCYVMKKLTKHITYELQHGVLNQPICTIRSECVSDNLRYLIYKHLFSTIDDQNLELFQKVSELIHDLLSISTLHAKENEHLKIPNNQNSSAPSTSFLENKSNTVKEQTSMLETSVSQANNILMEDIYSSIEFNDKNVQVLPNHLQEAKVIENVKGNDLIRKQVKPFHLEKTIRSGIVNVALASVNKSPADDASLNTLNNNSSNTRHLATPNRTERGSNVTRFNSNTEQSMSHPNEAITMPELHDYCVEVFRNHCKMLPILATSTDLAEFAREGVLHNILKLFYMLQEDPDIVNDYTYFEYCFEGEIGGLLDMLPQTAEMVKMREIWKIKLVMDAVKILKYMHKITDGVEFRQKLNQALNRLNIMEENRIENEEAQQLNALRMAEQYITSSNYQDENLLNVKIYRQRLMNRVNEVYDSAIQRQAKSFLQLSIGDLNDIAFTELANVPLPNNGNIMRQEIDLVNLNDEIEKWYNNLSIKPSEGINVIKRKIATQVLAKKIYDMERNMDLNEPSVERDMIHEISMFLCNRTSELEDNQDLNINFMVEELVNILRRIRHDKLLDYESFKKDLPFSSTIMQHDPVSEEFDKYDPQPYVSQNINMLKQNERVHFGVQSQPQQYQKLPRENNGSISNECNNGKLRPIAKSTVKGILGTSQMPGPSQDPSSFSTVSGTRANRPRNSPETVSLFTPLTSTASRKTYYPKQFYEISELAQSSPSRVVPINSDRRTSSHPTRTNQFQNERPDGYLIHEDITRFTIDPHNFSYLGRQEAPKLLSGGHGYGSTSTAPVIPGLTGNNIKRNDTFHVESERDWDQNRIRCRCGERHLRRRRRYACCCEDFFSMPRCCLLPYDYYF